MFFQFCDALEVKDGVNAGPDGWGLENAIYSWGNFWNTTYYNYGKLTRFIFSVCSANLRYEVCGTEDAEYVFLLHSALELRS